MGAGNSGTDFARKARAFHMRTIGLRRSARPTPDFNSMYSAADFDALLAAADFVVVTTPLTAETHGMFDEAQFRAMKKEAFFICISRGGIADDAALLRASREGWIARAGLDGHSVEPLPSDSPFWDAPNTILTSHNGTTTLKTKDRAYYIFRDNLARYLRGEPLENVVDKQNGY